ncbi:bola protein [Amylocarpus encephaloides]|uniref:Bola protein n=1 Tax=Amylocarpus encephaloides TaxID=45428 RepID=A0A9P7YAV8_9HELO|nr:bola protein [Amylocarpus encephaloides]
MAEGSEITEARLKTKLVEQLQAIYVEIEDMSGGCGQAFSAVIVSPQFEKKRTLARHRLVNGALKSEIAAIHAWTPKCYTPEQWEKQKAEGNATVSTGEGTTGEVVNGTAM